MQTVTMGERAFNMGEIDKAVEYFALSLVKIDVMMEKSIIKNINASFGAKFTEQVYVLLTEIRQFMKTNSKSEDDVSRALDEQIFNALKSMGPKIEPKTSDEMITDDVE